MTLTGMDKQVIVECAREAADMAGRVRAAGTDEPSYANGKLIAALNACCEGLGLIGRVDRGRLLERVAMSFDRGVRMGGQEG